MDKGFTLTSTGAADVWSPTKCLRWKETLHLNTNYIERVLQQLYRSSTGKEEWQDIEIVKVN